VDLPKIISVDDHVVEPSHVWQTWLPEKHRERGPKVEARKWGAFRHKAGARYDMTEDPDGEWGDAWYYDDKLIYVHKRFVAIPSVATTEDDAGKIEFDRSHMTMTPVTYDEMRPGCWQVEARIKDFDLNWVDGSLPFPTFPRFCGQTFYEGDDKELGLACVRAYNDWMVEEWCGTSRGYNIPLCLIPLWDVELAAAETQRNADRGVRAICFSELPHHLKLPTIHSGYWDPLFQVCNDNGVTVCMHIGSSSTTPLASPDAPKAVGGMIAFNNCMASMGDWLFSRKLIEFPELKLAFSEGQIGWIPYALERADTVWDHHDSWMNSKSRIPEPPSTYYYGRIFGCFTADRHGLANLEAVGPDNICFETDYPHTDTTWPHSREYAEKMVAGLDDEAVYKILRGNAIKMLELDRV
jgi:predicted TIM-barrel fold metal-dependent hydrolase